jgi:chemotaxis protein methyltransferase CheR
VTDKDVLRGAPGAVPQRADLFFQPVAESHSALFRDSLVRGGYLCLGLRESLDFAPVAVDFSAVDAGMRLYRRTLQLTSETCDAPA